MSEFIGQKPFTKEEIKRMEAYFTAEEGCLTLPGDDNVESFRLRLSLFLRDRLLVLGNTLNFGLRRNELIKLKLGQLFDFEQMKPRTSLRIIGSTLKKKTKVDTAALILAELRALKGEKVDVTKVPRKGRPPPSREIPLLKKVQKWIDDLVHYWPTIYLEEPKPDDWAFQCIRRKGKMLGPVGAHYCLKRVLQRSGCSTDHGTHAMRKTLAKTIYENSDKDITAVARFLGHSNVQSTMSYLRTNVDQRQLLEKNEEKN